jgi:dolichol-phosphate mannosyltransferase
MKILCIIPIYNEESRLIALIEKISKFKENNPKKIEFMAINNGSSDNTDKLLRESNLNFIRLRKNKGIGYSLLLGLRLAAKKNYDILIHMAGNNKMSPFDIDKMIKPIIYNNFDYVSGSRFLDKNNNVTNPLFRKVSIKFLSIFFSIAFKKKITDATCGFRAFRIKGLIKYFIFLNKKKYYTYGYEYYSYGKILLSKSIKSCEASVEMNYPKSGKYSKIRPVIDWYPIIWGYLESIFDKVKFEK